MRLSGNSAKHQEKDYRSFINCMGQRFFSLQSVLAICVLMGVSFTQVDLLQASTQYDNQILKVDVQKGTGNTVKLNIYTSEDNTSYKHGTAQVGSATVHTFDFDKTLNSVNNVVTTNTLKNIVEDVKVKQLIDTSSQTAGDFARIIVTVNDKNATITPVIHPLHKKAPKVVSSDTSKMKILEVQNNPTSFISKSLVEVEKPQPFTVDNSYYGKSYEDPFNPLTLSDPVSTNYYNSYQPPSSFLSYPRYNKYKNSVETISPQDVSVVDLPANEVGELEDVQNLSQANLYLAQNQPTDSLANDSLEQPKPERKLKTNFIISTDLDQSTIFMTIVVVLIISVLLSTGLYFFKKYMDNRVAETKFPRPIPKMDYKKYTQKVEHFLHDEEIALSTPQHETQTIYSPGSYQDNSPVSRSSNGSQEDHVMNIEVIDAVTVEEGKDIFLVLYEGKHKLVGYEEEDVYVISSIPNFVKPTSELHVTFVGLAAGVRMYEVKIENWHSVICHKDGKFVLHTVINPT